LLAATAVMLAGSMLLLIRETSAANALPCPTATAMAPSKTRARRQERKAMTGWAVTF